MRRFVLSNHMTAPSPERRMAGGLRLEELAAQLDQLLNPVGCSMRDFCFPEARHLAVFHSIWAVSVQMLASIPQPPFFAGPSHIYLYHIYSALSGTRSRHLLSKLLLAGMFSNLKTQCPNVQEFYNDVPLLPCVEVNPMMERCGAVL